MDTAKHRSRSYTLDDATRATGLSRVTIARAVQSGDLRSELLHGFRLIQSDDLARWQDNREGRARASRPSGARECGS